MHLHTEPSLFHFSELFPFTAFLPLQPSFKTCFSLLILRWCFKDKSFWGGGSSWSEQQKTAERSEKGKKSLCSAGLQGTFSCSTVLQENEAKMPKSHKKMELQGVFTHLCDGGSQIHQIVQQIGPQTFQTGIATPVLQTAKCSQGTQEGWRPCKSQKLHLELIHDFTTAQFGTFSWCCFEYFTNFYLWSRSLE